MGYDYEGASDIAYEQIASCIMRGIFRKNIEDWPEEEQRGVNWKQKKS